MSRRDLTAMTRSELSKPMQIAIEHEVVTPKLDDLEGNISEIL